MSSVLDGTYYEPKTKSFWGFVKKIFKADDDDEIAELLPEAQEMFFIPALLEQTCESIVRYMS